MSFGVEWFELYTFIFYVLALVLKYVNLILLDSAKVYQGCTTNEGYIIGNKNIGACKTLHCLAL